MGFGMHAGLFGSPASEILSQALLGVSHGECWALGLCQIRPHRRLTLRYSGVESPLEADAFPMVLSAAEILGPLLLNSCCYLSLH